MRCSSARAGPGVPLLATALGTTWSALPRRRGIGETGSRDPAHAARLPARVAGRGDRARLDRLEDAGRGVDGGGVRLADVRRAGLLARARCRAVLTWSMLPRGIVRALVPRPM